MGDRDFFIENRMVKSNFELLPGSGVNLDEYQFSELPPDDEVNFIMIGRIMKVKGIDEYLACAKEVKGKYPHTNFFLAGFIEEDIYIDIIRQYEQDGYVTYIGFQKGY